MSEDAQLDVVSGEILPRSPTLRLRCVDLNFSVLKLHLSNKLFSTDEIRVLFIKEAFGPVLLGGGRIFLVGDFTESFCTPPSTGGGGGNLSRTTRVTVRPPAVREPSVPFSELLGITRDSRPVDYRRIERPNDYHFKRYYEYLDRVSSWEYSLKLEPREKRLSDVSLLGTTNFGTFLAASCKIASGRINILPSLGSTSEADENYVLQHFLGFSVSASPPAWVGKFIVIGQREIESRIKDGDERVEILQKALDLESQPRPVRTLEATPI